MTLGIPTDTIVESSQDTVGTRLLTATTDTSSAAPDRGVERILPNVGEWFLLRVKSRQEKALHTTLRAMDVKCFLPLIPAVRFYGKRKEKVRLPMFPGYVFLRGVPEDAYRADRTGRLVSIIPVSDQARLDCELNNLALALRRQAPLEPYRFLTSGRRVEVRSGPFEGLQGVIEGRNRADQLILQVDMLGRAMSLEIEPSLLDVID